MELFGGVFCVRKKNTTSFPRAKLLYYLFNARFHPSATGQNQFLHFFFSPRHLPVLSDWHISALMIETDTWSPISSVAAWGCLVSRGWSFTHLTKAIRSLRSVRALVDVATVCSCAGLKMNGALTRVMWPVVFAVLNHQLLSEMLQVGIGYNRAIGAHWHPHARRPWSQHW